MELICLSLHTPQFPAHFHLLLHLPITSLLLNYSRPCHFINCSGAYWLAVPFWNSSSSNACIPFVYLTSICSSTQHSLKGMAAGDLDFMLINLFTRWFSQWTVSCWDSHRSRFPLYPQCLARSLETISFQHKFKDYSKRQSSRPRLYNGSLQIPVCSASRADRSFNGSDAEGDDLFSGLHLWLVGTI